MRWASLIALIACSGTAELAPTKVEGATRSQPNPPVTVTPAVKTAPCARILGREQLLPGAPTTQRLRWLDRDTIGVLINGGNDIAAASRPETSGIVTYDLQRNYKPTDLPMHSYRVDAEDFVMRAGRRAVMLVSSDGVGTLDLDTGCVRAAKLHVTRALAGDSPLLAAFDPVKGRFFAISDGTFVRVDADTFEVTTGLARIDQAESRVAAIAFDPTSDLVFGRLSGNKVLVLDAATLAERSSFEIPGATVLQGGPYVRPGHSEAMFVYEVACKQHKRQPPTAMPLGRSCVDPVDQVRVARVDLTTGTIIETHVLRGARDARGEPRQGWSGDGNRFVVPTEGFVWEPPGTPTKLRPPGDFIYKFELDPTGTRFADGDSYSVRIRELANGHDTWSVFLPRERVKQQ